MSSLPRYHPEVNLCGFVQNLSSAANVLLEHNTRCIGTEVYCIMGMEQGGWQGWGSTGFPL